MLESKVADINNVASGSFAGSITAALFMRRFVERQTWVHVDITPGRRRPSRPA